MRKKSSGQQLFAASGIDDILYDIPEYKLHRPGAAGSDRGNGIIYLFKFREDHESGKPLVHIWK